MLRRVMLLALVAPSAAIVGTDTMIGRAAATWRHLDGGRGLLLLFGILFAWISAGFLDRRDGRLGDAARGAIATPSRTRWRAARCSRFPAEARTAIIMPICNEDVATVFGGLRATYEIAGPGRGARALRLLHPERHTGNPELRAAEQAAWGELVEALGRDGQPVRHPLPVGASTARHRKAGQRRGFLPPLGRCVPLHGRARCRQAS